MHISFWKNPSLFWEIANFHEYEVRGGDSSCDISYYDPETVVLVLRSLRRIKWGPLRWILTLLVQFNISAEILALATVYSLRSFLLLSAYFAVEADTITLGTFTWRITINVEFWSQVMIQRCIVITGIDFTLYIYIDQCFHSTCEWWPGSYSTR